MLNHIIALFGLIALCSGWVLFQIWVGKQDSHPVTPLKPGCSTCDEASCCQER